jgi:hypothetical protein
VPQYQDGVASRLLDGGGVIVIDLPNGDSGITVRDRRVAAHFTNEGSSGCTDQETFPNPSLYCLSAITVLQPKLTTPLPAMTEALTILLTVLRERMLQVHQTTADLGDTVILTGHGRDRGLLENNLEKCRP